MYLDTTMNYYQKYIWNVAIIVIGQSLQNSATLQSNTSKDDGDQWKQPAFAAAESKH